MILILQLKVVRLEKKGYLTLKGLADQWETGQWGERWRDDSDGKLNSPGFPRFMLRLAQLWHLMATEEQLE